MSHKNPNLIGPTACGCGCGACSRAHAEVRRLIEALHAMEDPCGRCVDMALSVAAYRDAALKLRAVLLDLPPRQTAESAAVVDNAIQAAMWIVEPGHE